MAFCAAFLVVTAGCVGGREGGGGRVGGAAGLGGLGLSDSPCDTSMDGMSRSGRPEAGLDERWGADQEGGGRAGGMTEQPDCMSGAAKSTGLDPPASRKHVKNRCVI